MNLIKYRFYDYIFYNLGVIGSIIAQKYEKNGDHALILEKNREFGINRRCGNYIEKDFLKKIDLDDISQIIQAETNELIYFNAENQETSSQKREILILDPRLFEKLIATKAALSGVDIKINSRIKSLNNQNKNIKSILIKSFKDKRIIKIGHLISGSIIGQEKFIINNKSTESKIYTTQYEIYSPKFCSSDCFSIYKFQNPPGLIMVFPTLRNNFYVWQIGRLNKLKIEEFLKDFLKIRDYSIISINYQEFNQKTHSINNQYLNHLIIGAENGLINPNKHHYLMTRIEMGIFISNMLKKGTIFLPKSEKNYWNKFIPILI